MLNSMNYGHSKAKIIMTKSKKSTVPKRLQSNHSELCDMRPELTHIYIDIPKSTLTSGPTHVFIEILHIIYSLKMYHNTGKPNLHTEIKTLHSREYLHSLHKHRRLNDGSNEPIIPPSGQGIHNFHQTYVTFWGYSIPARDQVGELRSLPGIKLRSLPEKMLRSLPKYIDLQ